MAPGNHASYLGGGVSYAGSKHILHRCQCFIIAGMDNEAKIVFFSIPHASIVLSSHIKNTGLCQFICDNMFELISLVVVVFKHSSWNF
jgi:hypothetical protein